MNIPNDARQWGHGHSDTAPAYPVQEADDTYVRIEASAEGGTWVIVVPPAPAPSFAMTVAEARRLADKLSMVVR